jgi:hypothetical protein
MVRDHVRSHISGAYSVTTTSPDSLSARKDAYWRAEAVDMLDKAGIHDPSDEVVQATIKLFQMLQWRTGFVWP